METGESQIVEEKVNGNGVQNLELGRESASDDGDRCGRTTNLEWSTKNEDVRAAKGLYPFDGRWERNQGNRQRDRSSPN